jgi:DHA3 family macrolide efflux protein-like MFS transporter
LALAAVALAFGAPVLIAAPLAGAWADRHDRKRTMIAMDFSSGILDLVLLVLLLTSTLQLWLLISIMVISAFLNSFHNAAFDTSYAMIVPEKQLPRANGMMQTIFSLAGILSPGIAAVLLAIPFVTLRSPTTLQLVRDGTPLAILVDTITFFVAAVVPFFLYVPSPQRTDRGADGKFQTSIWQDVGFGATYIWHRAPMLWLLGTFTLANFVGGIFVLEPLLVKFNLHADYTAHGLQFAAALALVASVTNIGGVIGGVVMSSWGGLKTRRVFGILIPMIIAGGAIMGYGLSPFIFLTAAMGFIDSAMIPFLNSHSQAIWQSLVPRELQGRVFSVRRLIAQFTFPISTAIMGWAGGVFNPAYVIATLGAIYVVFCAIQLFNPYLRRVEDRAWIEQVAARRRGVKPAVATASEGLQPQNPPTRVEV